MVPPLPFMERGLGGEVHKKLLSNYNPVSPADRADSRRLYAKTGWERTKYPNTRTPEHLNTIAFNLRSLTHLHSPCLTPPHTSFLGAAGSPHTSFVVAASLLPSQRGRYIFLYKESTG